MEPVRAPARFAHNERSLRLLLWATVPFPAALGLMHLVAPRLLISLLGKSAVKSPYIYSDGFMGAVFCAFATTAAIGLATDPGAFLPLILLQCLYKVYHLGAMAAARAPLDAHNAAYVAVWLVYIAADAYVLAPALKELRRGKGKQP